MIIYDKTGEVLFDVQVNDSSVRNRAIMGDNSVTLNLSLPEYATIPVGSYIEYQGQRYTLWSPDNFKKHGTRNFEYKITFGSNQEILKRYKYKSLSDIPFQLKFTLTAKPKMFLQLLVDNLNLRDSGWTVGDCIVATEKYLSFNHEYCYDVLGRLAQEFNTEWEIDGKTIHLRKVEKFKTEPLALSYGKGNGFRPGVGRATQGDKSPLNLLFVQGGDRNIDLATYNSRYLLLPKSKELEYEGRKYKTDKDGMYITRADKEVSQYNEDSYDASNIYPSRVGEVTAVTTEEGTDNEGNPVTFYNIVDTTIPADLNYRDCRIAGEKATMIFQTGVLTGREFDIVQTDTDLTGYDHATRTFELVPLEEDGVTLPNENLKPAIGDKYAIFNIKLPQAYIQDDATQTGASWEMFKEAVRYFYENEEEKFSFTGELDPIWAKNKWLEIGGKIVPGGYIQFSDTQFQPEGILIRITSVKDYINKPHAPVIELSNVPVGGSITTDLGKIDSNDVVDENRYKGSISLTKRRFRDLEETGKMLEAAIDGFSEAINPIYIQTMSLQVGSESLQFRFVNNKTNPVETIPNFDYNQKTKVFTAPTTILQHMTLGIDKISPTHKPSDYKFWDMSSYTSPSLDETAAMYFYAKCSKTRTTGSFLLSKTAYKMDPGDGYYYFLVGTLSSEYEGERSYRNVYGFTEVLPGSITTSVIASSDGQTYFNLVDGEIVAAHLTIKSGSGYNNLTDKPDLGIYATNAELSIQSDRISATVESIKKIDNTISDLNTLYATKAELSIQSDRISATVESINKIDNTISDLNTLYATKAELSIQSDRISATVESINKIDNTIKTSGWITQDYATSIFAAKSDLNTLKTSVASLSVQYNQISSAVGTNTQGIKDAKDLASKACEVGLYSQEQYSQTSNPWNNWSSGAEFKHVGALWYNPSTKITKRYTGIDGSNSWETVNDSAVTAASFVLQNKDKWQLVVANFNANGNPTEESGILTTAYGNTLYAKKDGIISAINQTPEAISIEASKINLIGATRIGKYLIKDGWLVGDTTGGANDAYALMKLRHTKNSDGSFSQITLGSNVNSSLVSNQRVTARIYNGISNKSSVADWGYYYRNTALQLESNYSDVNLALETIGGRMHRGKLWETEEISPITGAGTYSLEKNGSLFLFRDLKADLTFELPLYSTIQKMFGNFQSGVAVSTYGVYTIRLLIDRNCSRRVLVAGTSTTPLLNNNGDIQNDASGVSYGARWMARGDFLVLVFYNKAWYIQSFSY